MSCSNCFKFDEESFDYAMMWKDFCCWKKPYKRCLVCQAKIYYLNYEYDIYKNSFDLDFLAKLQANVRKNLLRLLMVDSHFVCKLINTRYGYLHKDWFSGVVEKFYLPHCSDVYENKKIDKIKTKECKIVIEPLPKKYLSIFFS